MLAGGVLDFVVGGGGYGLAFFPLIYKGRKLRVIQEEKRRASSPALTKMNLIKWDIDFQWKKESFNQLVSYKASRQRHR